MDHDGLRYTVVPAVSALAVRDALTQGDEDRVVVLTDLEDEEIGIGVLAHAVRQRSMVLDVWDTVRQQMRVRDVLDSNLVRDGETVARALVDREPADGWPPAPGGVLTRDHAYRCLVSTLLGLAPRQLDVPGVLDWSRHPSGVLALHDLDEPLARLLVSWLVDQLGRRCRTGARPVPDGPRDGRDRPGSGGQSPVRPARVRAWPGSLRATLLPSSPTSTRPTVGGCVHRVGGTGPGDRPHRGTPGPGQRRGGAARPAGRPGGRRVEAAARGARGSSRRSRAGTGSGCRRRHRSAAARPRRRSSGWRSTCWPAATHVESSPA